MKETFSFITFHNLRKCALSSTILSRTVSAVVGFTCLPIKFFTLKGFSFIDTHVRENPFVPNKKSEFLRTFFSSKSNKDLRKTEASW